MSEQDRLIREAALEEKRMVRTARDLWSSERAAWVKRAGPGFLRYTEKRSLGAFRDIVPRVLTSGGTWADIERGIKVTAADPQRSPWGVFDAALEAQARREDMERAADKAERDRREFRPARGLRPLGESTTALVHSLADSEGDDEHKF
jgi:hypothetical protein